MQKINQPEIIDLGKPHYSLEEYHQCLNYLGKIGQYLGGDKAIFQALNQLCATPKYIIDFGCGGGTLAARLAKKYPDCKVLGVDSSQDAIQYALKNFPKEIYPNLEFKLVDHNHYTIAPNSVDVVISSLTFHHLTESQILEFLTMSTKAAPKGVIVNDLHRSRLAWILFYLLTKVVFNNRLIKHDGLLSIKRSFKRYELQQLLKKAKIKSSYFNIQWKWAFRWIITIKTT